MTMKKLLYFPLLIILLASLIFGALPFGQPSIVYAAPGTLQLLPDGVGDYTNIASVEPAATAHWDAVNDPVGAPDDITTYVYTTSATQEKDAYTLQDTTQTGPINSVTVYFRAGGEKNKNHEFQPFLILGAAETSGTVQAHSAVAFTTYNQTLARPGGGDWTWADINNLQVAIGLTNVSSSDPYLTQVYVEVDYTPPPADISNSPGDYNFGILSESTTANTTLTYFEVTNNSGFAVNITIGGTDMIGGVTWTLDNNANPGEDTYGLKAGLAGGSYNITVMKTGPYNTLVGGLLNGNSQKWGLQLLAPTSFTGGGLVSGNVTLTATQV